MYIDSCIVPTYYYDPHKLAWGLLFSGAHSHWGCSPSTHTPYTNIFKSFFYYIHTYIHICVTYLHFDGPTPHNVRIVRS